MSTNPGVGWTYHVVLGDGTESRCEVGPLPTATEAVSYAVSVMGATVAALHAQGAPGRAVVEDLERNTGREVLICFTIERCDAAGEAEPWVCINGGLNGVRS